jgi:hypothetical protein
MQFKQMKFDIKVFLLFLVPILKPKDFFILAIFYLCVDYLNKDMAIFYLCVDYLNKDISYTPDASLKTLEVSF